MDSGGKAGDGRQEETDGQAAQPHRYPPEAWTGPDHQETDHRGEAGAIQRQIDVFGKFFPPVQGVKPSAHNNRGDVDQVFPQQGEACH